MRPVSTRPTHEISEEERRYEDGRDPQLLDIVFVPCESHQPLPHQRENHVIDPGYYWAPQGTWHGKTFLDGSTNRIRSGGPEKVATLASTTVWPGGSEDGSSLYLISVDRLRLLVGVKLRSILIPSGL